MATRSNINDNSDIFKSSVMILAGGLGTRLREETEFRPKPLVPIGGRPILWHIMKMYAHYGFRRFIICLGYKGNLIKDYFLNYHFQGVDVTVNTSTGRLIEHQKNGENWDVTLVETGEDTQTGFRIKKAAQYVDTGLFMLTYGDGVGDVNIQNLLDFHIKHGKKVTLTGVKNPFRFGSLATQGDYVTNFIEKQEGDETFVNGGFFVVNTETLLDFSDVKTCTFEQDILPLQARKNELMMYRHKGFWQCMDTIRDHEKLESLWRHGAPWKIWEENPFTVPLKTARIQLEQL